MTPFLNELGKAPSEKDWLTMFVIGKARMSEFSLMNLDGTGSREQCLALALESISVIYETET